MTKCIEHYNCPQTRLVGISYSACIDWYGEKVIPSTDVKRALSVPHDESVFKIAKERNEFQHDKIQCIDVEQRVDPDRDVRVQAREGFGILSRVREAISIPLYQISLVPSHENRGFFMWDFREHESLLDEWKKFAKETGGKEMEAHDYAEIEYGRGQTDGATGDPFIKAPGWKRS
jgi:hypothetical protein